RVDLSFRPEEAGEILHPLEIADSHATGVADHVRNDEDTPLDQHVVGCRQGRPVGSFENEARFDPPRPLRRDLPFESRRNEDVAIGLPKGLVRYALGALKPLTPPQRATWAASLAGSKPAELAMEPL